MQQERSKRKQFGFLSPTMLYLTIVQNEITGGAQKHYAVRAGDRIVNDERLPDRTRWIVRNGERLGVLVSGVGGDKIWMPEYLIEQTLNVPALTDVNSYQIEDVETGKTLRVIDAGYKQKPIEATDPGMRFILETTVSIELNEPLVQGHTYRMSCPALEIEPDTFLFDFAPEKTRSLAVHTTQHGYRPNDGGKVGYLSFWRGELGGVEYGDVRFALIDQATGETVFEGAGERAGGEEPSPIANGDEITVHAPVWRLDFSSVTRPGRYVLFAEDIGTSESFEIGHGVWTDAFRVSMHGLFCHHSGVELGPPYTDYIRPRPYHPLDGQYVFQSTCSLLASGNGLNAYGTDTDNFGNLVAGRTDELVPDAWGGYFDACDWDRRIQHLEVTRLLLEMYMLYPSAFERVRLNRPDSGNGLCDVLNECAFNLDFYRRLQLENGGIRGGVEAEDHPLPGECAWQDSFKAMAYAPDHWCSFLYAATAAMFAIATDDRSGEYAKSAIAAARWGIQEEAAREEDSKSYSERALEEIASAKNLMAVWMYRLTGDSAFHTMFVNTYGAAMSEALFANAKADFPKDGAIVSDCKARLIESAESAIAFAGANPYNVTISKDRTYTGPYGYLYSVPDGVALLRAYALSGEKRYVDAAIAGLNVSLGANPMDLCYTTGLGHNQPTGVLHHDSRRTGQRTPDGITLYGNFNLATHPNHSSITNVEQAGAMTPAPEAYPSMETYLGIYLYPGQCEYTVMQTIGPMAYIFGSIDACGGR